MKLLHWALAAGALLPCACTVASPPTAPSVLAIADRVMLADGFEPAFFQAFVRNGFEAPGRLEPIRILRGPLRIYLRTVDDAGRAIDGGTLDAAEQILADSAWIWSGETFGVAEVARGLRTREHVSGWLTVKWSSTPLRGGCGRSTVGIEGGVIELDASGACSCGLKTLVYPRLIRHELGHAMGYYHTGDDTDVMYGFPISASACDLQPSDRERRHARFVYRETY